MIQTFFYDFYFLFLTIFSLKERVLFFSFMPQYHQGDRFLPRPIASPGSNFLSVILPLSRPSVKSCTLVRFGQATSVSEGDPAPISPSWIDPWFQILALLLTVGHISYFWDRSQPSPKLPKHQHIMYFRILSLPCLTHQHTILYPAREGVRSRNLSKCNWLLFSGGPVKCSKDKTLPKFRSSDSENRSWSHTIELHSTSSLPT